MAFAEITVNGQVVQVPSDLAIPMYETFQAIIQARASETVVIDAQADGFLYKHAFLVNEFTQIRMSVPAVHLSPDEYPQTLSDLYKKYRS